MQAVESYIRFKTDRLRDEWVGGDLHPALKLKVLAAAHWHFMQTGVATVVTSLLRTEEEQRNFYPTQPQKRSVHQYGRGADLRTAHISMRAGEWAAWINQAYPYIGTPGKRTALVHEINGHGQHLHLQVGGSELEPVAVENPVIQEA